MHMRMTNIDFRILRRWVFRRDCGTAGFLTSLTFTSIGDLYGSMRKSDRVEDHNTYDTIYFQLYHDSADSNAFLTAMMI